MSTATSEQAAESLRQFVAECRRRFDTDPQWIAARADARALGLKPEAVYAFKQRHHLPRDQRLSPAALQLLELELENAQRLAKGQQIEQTQALQVIAQRATTEAAQAIAAVVPFQAQFSLSGTWVLGSQIEAYLINRVEALTGTRYATAGHAWKRAAALAPAAIDAAAGLKSTGRRSTQRANAERLRLCLFWGVILRLDQLEGPPPTDPAAFYRWSQLEAYAHHRPPLPSLGDVLAGRMDAAAARALLQLPATGPLAPAAIRSAYRAEARHHHPDTGGDRRRFEQISAARDRLLQEVA